jgi:hypothetical protein
MINDATTNFGFKHLEGSDEAGYNTINELITDIDNELYARVAKPGMIMIFDDTATIPTGWSSLGATPTGLPALTSPYIWIKKDA